MGSWGSFARLALGRMGKAGGKTDSFQGTDLYPYGDYWLSSPRTIGTPEDVRVAALADSGLGRSCLPDIAFLFLKERVLPIIHITCLLDISRLGAVIASEKTAIMILTVVKAEILPIERTEWVFYSGFLGTCHLWKEFRDERKVLLKCGSIPAVSEHALSREKISQTLKFVFC